MIEYVLCYPFTINANRKFTVLMHKSKPERLKGVLNLPGGKINPKETKIDAAVRELKEETGLEEIQEYDGMVYYPPEYLGKIKGNGYNVHCVKIPVTFQQKLNPGEEETEPVAWFPVPELCELPKLMPNLRLIIPLMEEGVKDWVIEDIDIETEGWRWQNKHRVKLTLNKYNAMEVLVKGMGAYES